MKMIYEKPELELVTFQSEEAITASVNGRAVAGVLDQDAERRGVNQ